ncbi:hypothetical protein FA95DRAFT_1585270 [Auriscalpium vulgare]|uniref:Uncharacterized protein n=1 Tax=Auriscalpium vulgare TaxID=40419 RepID=A0ACB8R6I6_9AGAM|nr:hypothetical protein FA95DRAFT_1585270 [Auriscalpium vulgare]
MKTELKIGDSDAEYALVYRDPLECIRSLYGNVAFVNSMSYAPRKEYSGGTREEDQRLYNEMCTGDWWHKTQMKLSDGATVVPVVFSSDKTLLTNFSGDDSAYPLYLTIGNIDKDVRRKPSNHAHMLVGYLPTPDLSHLSKTIASTVRARIYHHAMKVIVQSLEAAGQTGVQLTGGDGAIRLCFPILACYVADFPEQALVACTRGSRCPKCELRRGGFGDHRHESPARQQGVTIRIIRRAANEPTASKQEAMLKEKGLINVTHPFWANLPHCNIHDTITPDVLHQLYQGMIKHLLVWLSNLMGEAELDARFRRLPEAHGIRRFMNGISGLSRVTGGEHKEICKQILGCLSGKAPAGAIRAARGLLDFLYIARYRSHTGETIGYLRDALDLFHRNKKIFLKTSARVGAGDGFDIPKLESLQHYIPSICAIGTTDNCDTETTERLHIDFAKDAYRASNKREYLEQMMLWLERKEKWRSGEPQPKTARRARRARGAPPSFIPSSHTAAPSSNPSATPSASTAASKVAGRILLAKTPAVASVPLVQLQQTYGAHDLVPALHTFLSEHINADRHRRGNDNMALLFDSVDVWHKIKFVLPNLQLEDLADTTNTVTAKPPIGDKPGRFDTVIVDEDDSLVEQTGQRHDTNHIAGQRIGRLRVIFKLPAFLDDELFKSRGVDSPGHLAYVEWFSRPTEKDGDTSMYKITKSKKSNGKGLVSAVIEVESIRRGCQLIPRFGARADRAWKPSNVLDRCDSFLLNNYGDQHAFQSIW